MSSCQLLRLGTTVQPSAQPGPLLNRAVPDPDGLSPPYTFLPRPRHAAQERHVTPDLGPVTVAEPTEQAGWILRVPRRDGMRVGAEVKEWDEMGRVELWVTGQGKAWYSALLITSLLVLGNVGSQGWMGTR